MLAAHLRRLERPVRYAAMDPAHVRAIENYLRINTRAHGLPHTHYNLTGPDSTIGQLYQQRPEIAPHFQGILQGDNAALAQYLDLLDEHGDLRHTFGSQPAPHQQLANFLMHLDSMRRAAEVGRVPSSHGDDRSGNIHTMYSQAALEHPDTQNEVRRVIHYGNLIDRLRDLPAYHVPHGQQGLYRGTGLRNQAMAGDIHGLLGLHDLAADPSNDPAEAAGVHRQLEAGLRNRLIPHLAENFG